MKVTAVVGTYRRDGVVDTLVDAVLEDARAAGAETRKIHLLDARVEFCRNCRACTQTPGPERGVCPLPDEMGAILDEIAASDAVVLASPMNFWTVTALMKRFIERLVCFAWWPWGMGAPKTRPPDRARRGLIVASSAAPAPLARWMTRMVPLMRSVLRMLGVRRPEVLFVGLCALRERQRLPEKTLRRARALGAKLALPL